MFVLLAAALVGDLILLPALLVTPLGRFFHPPQESKLIRPRRSCDGAEIQRNGHDKSQKIAPIDVVVYGSDLSSMKA